MLSVICPVFNAEPRLLELAIASVQREAAAAKVPAEVILVDDGSSRDDTRAMLAALGGREGLVLLRPGRNAGPAAARNLGIAAARGAWLGFLDADDLWLPGGLAAARPWMAEADTAWLLGRHALLRPDGLHASPSLATALGVTPPRMVGGRALTRCLIGNSWIHLGAMLLRRDLARRAGGFAEGLYYSEDVLLAIRLSAIAPLRLLDADLYAWRRAGGGLTGSPARLTDRWLEFHRVAARDPLLRGFRREIRWARYAALKGLAKNNLLAGQRGAGLRYALRAWAADPREWRDFAHFLALLRQGEAADASGYSRAETFTPRSQP
jgi:GT2 family glycosyltransferase